MRLIVGVAHFPHSLAVLEPKEFMFAGRHLLFVSVILPLAEKLGTKRMEFLKARYLVALDRHRRKFRNLSGRSNRVLRYLLKA